MNYKALKLIPRISEKTYELSQKLNLYVFIVPLRANRLTVAQAVKEQFGVNVDGVNIMRSKGKAKRTIRRGGRPIAGHQSEIKKAYVTIKAGESIPIFQNEDDSAKKTKKEKK